MDLERFKEELLRHFLDVEYGPFCDAVKEASSIASYVSLLQEFLNYNIYVSYGQRIT